MPSTTFTDPRALAPAAALALAACVGSADATPDAAAAAAALAPGLPRELAPGLMAVEAAAEGGELVLRMNAAADLGLPDAAGFARPVCAWPPAADHLAAGGALRLDLRGRTLARIDRCPGGS
ncbi:MAG: hypothetical protein N2Z62_01710 [Rhodobacteraceae bacterium]|nr:hypothetical protein [Paracoccaceae bacterium]